ncbi:MAG: alpha/beta fold hydrolase [Phycisphaerae bacterium]|nr:alpha/beta fold hydrolase [Phycisphaerae bacterium]
MVCALFVAAVAARASEPDPSVAGPYQVGYYSLTMVDFLRDAREIPVDVWFPIVSGTGTGTALYTEADLMPGLQWPAPSAQIGGTASGEGPFPLVVFSHGAGCSIYSYVNTIETLASHGFVVVAPTHRGNTLTNYMWGNGDALPRVLLDRTRDISFVIGAMLDHGATPGDPLYQVIDADEVGVMGHSWGGFAAMGTPGGYKNEIPDARVKAIVPFGPSSDLLSGRDLSRVHVPALLIDGLGAERYQERAFNLLGGPDTHEALIPETRHYDFESSFCAFYEFLLANNAPSEVINFLAPQYADVCGTSSIGDAELARILNTYVVAFFSQHLKGDARYVPYISERHSHLMDPGIAWIDKAYPDFNGNGIEDTQDIAQGYSKDLNKDGVPDEAQVEILFVNAASINEVQDGLTWATAFRDLQRALRVAEAGPQHVTRQIWVAAGRYTPDSGTFERSRSFYLVDAVEVLGGFAGWEADPTQRNTKQNVTILSGDLLANNCAACANYTEDSNHVVRIHGNIISAVLDGVTIDGGNADFDDYGWGGGGLVASFAGDATIRDCVIRDCRAPRGGGAFVTLFSRPWFDRVAFVDNVAGVGGGAYIETPDADARFDSCLFARNLADSPGQGGGVAVLYDAAPRFTNCTIADNHAEFEGGGLYAYWDAQPKLYNSILWENTAEQGAQVRLDTINPGDFPCDVTVYFSCVEGGPERISVGAGNFVNWGDANISENPRFRNPAAGNYRLARDSSSIDWGTKDYLTEGRLLDLDGHDRIFEWWSKNGYDTEPEVDLGAYESACPADFNNDGSVDDFDLFDFLNAFYAGDPAADYNADLFIDDFDFFDILNDLYTGGC